jgi:predicted deacylase
LAQRARRARLARYPVIRAKVARTPVLVSLPGATTSADRALRCSGTSVASVSASLAALTGAMMYDAHSTSFLSTPSSARPLPPRWLGDIQGAAQGPTVVFVCGLYGDESDALLAAERAVPTLQHLRAALRGRVVFLAGNRQALASGVPFVRRDCNRGWTQRQLVRLQRLTPREVGDEDQEQLELAEALRAIEHEQRKPLVVIDLHGAPEPSRPFSCFVDTLRNRRLALSLPIGAVLGLEEVVTGTLSSYCTARGHVGISIEAGQGGTAEAVDRQVASIFLLLSAAGCLRERKLSGLGELREGLARASAGGPRVVEVLHRHAVEPGDGFRMLPGLTSFMPIEKGRVVAHDRTGAIRAPDAGLLFMPSYRDRGEEGFFVGREVRPVWLRISEWVRRSGAPRFLPLLPGIRRDPARPQLLLVNPRVARTHAPEVMHLCGYRRHPTAELPLVFSRTGPERH